MSGRISLNLYCLTVHRYKLRVWPSFDEIIRELMEQLKINVPGNFAYDLKGRIPKNQSKYLAFFNFKVHGERLKMDSP